MNCPLCKTEQMIVLELQEVEIDHCFKCKGIWLDAGELELLMGSDLQSRNFLEGFLPATHCSENKFKCPICDKKMEKIIVGENIIIDRCRNGHGLWFDEGELEQVISAGSFGKEMIVLNILREMFKDNLKK